MSEQPDFSTSPRPRRPPAREILALALAGSALAFAAHTAWVTRQEAAAARDRLAAVRREIGTFQARIRALGAGAAAGGELLTRAAAAGASPPERIVATLARALPGDARVERLSVVYGEEISLEMRVVARDPEAWDRTLGRLVEAESLEEVSPGPERREGEVRTTVRARWAERRR
jgi:hypothetical protein